MLAEDRILSCDEPMISTTQWVFSFLEILLSVGGLIFNSIVTVISHNAVPMSCVHRRSLTSLSLNFAVLSGFILARNFYYFLVIQKPCLLEVTTVSCKVQEFPLLFCYIHSALLCFLIGIQCNVVKTHPNDKKPLAWHLSFSVWQTVVAAICVSITLGFTAFDIESNIVQMSKCSILLAIRDATLVFGSVALMILLHFAGFFLISLSSYRRRNEKDNVFFTIASINEIVMYETIAWEVSLFFSGCVTLYKQLLTDPCDECSLIILEFSFVLIPLVISFSHPLLLIWFVLPMRDAATRRFSIIKMALPEYSLVPSHYQTENTTSTSLPAEIRVEEVENDQEKK